VTLPEPRPLYAYLGAVIAAGFGFLALLVATGHTALATGGGLVFWLFTAFVVLGEVFPLQVPRRDGEITTSTTFAFALLLAFGTPALALALAALVDFIRRRSLWRAAFNVAQFALSYGAAGNVLLLLAGVPRDGPLPHFTAGDLPAIGVAALVFFLLNNALAGTASALAQRENVLHHLREDLGFQAATAVVLLGLAPVVVVAASFSPAFAPLLLLPLGAVYIGGRQLALNDHHALHDALTGLPNRVFFRERAEQAMRQARRRHASVAVLLIDLDHFKEINDTLGHHYGDLLLQAVGPRLKGVLREDDMVARLGGDEFAALLPRVSGPSEAAEVAARLSSAIDSPFPLRGMQVHVSPSIGIACSPDHGSDVDVLLQRADVAMYLAKDDGKAYEVYSEARDKWNPDRLSIAGELRRAIEGELLTVYYQPQVDLHTAQVPSVEALARWEHPSRGLVEPNDFVPLAEHLGLIKPMTLTVVNAALRQCRSWHQQGLDLGVAVNVSVRSLLDRSLPDDIGQLLSKWSVDPYSLKLEITEGTVISDPSVLAVLEELHAMGIEISIDDFGTGYSSFAYLKRLPVTEVKIDKSFVLGMDQSAEDAMIVRSTIDLGHNLGLRVVAEGVEHERVWNELVTLGCDVVQGYYASRPMPAAELTAWLHAPRVAGRPLHVVVPPRPAPEEGAPMPPPILPLRPSAATAGEAAGDLL
jgi:diguanylate cyclase (GGDEF)-like protein